MSEYKTNTLQNVAQDLGFGEIVWEHGEYMAWLKKCTDWLEKYGEYMDWLEKYRVLKKDFAPFSQSVS
jgi:hypothetical protein